MPKNENENYLTDESREGVSLFLQGFAGASVVRQSELKGVSEGVLYGTEREEKK